MAAKQDVDGVSDRCHKMDQTKQRRRRYDRQRIYIGDAAELWECQRLVTGKSNPDFANLLLALHSASCANGCALDVSETDRSVIVTLPTLFQLWVMMQN